MSGHVSHCIEPMTIKRNTYKLIVRNDMINFFTIYTIIQPHKNISSERLRIPHIDSRQTHTKRTSLSYYHIVVCNAQSHRRMKHNQNEKQKNWCAEAEAAMTHDDRTTAIFRRNTTIVFRCVTLNSNAVGSGHSHRTDLIVLFCIATPIEQIIFALIKETHFNDSCTDFI